MNYEYPDELEFIEREFGLSDENDPNEGYFSYIYRYDDGRDLIITHSPFANVSFSVKLIENNETIFNVYQENVSSIVFQAWENDKIIRVYLNNHTELRVSYLPKPRLYLSNY